MMRFNDIPSSVALDDIMRELFFQYRIHICVKDFPFWYPSLARKCDVVQIAGHVWIAHYVKTTDSLQPRTNVKGLPGTIADPSCTVGSQAFTAAQHS